MSILQHRQFVIDYIQKTISTEDKEHEVEDLVDLMFEALQPKISELSHSKPPTRRSGYNSLSSILKPEQPPHILKLIASLGEITFSPEREYAPKTAAKVKEFPSDIFKTYTDLTEAHAAAKTQQLPGFAFSAFIWANLNKQQKKIINNYAHGDSDTLPLTNKKTKTTRKSGHNCIKTVVKYALDNTDTLLSYLLELPHYETKEKGREIGQQLWKDIKTSKFVELWHSIDKELPKTTKERENTIHTDTQFIQLLHDTINYVLE